MQKWWRLLVQHRSRIVVAAGLSVACGSIGAVLFWWGIGAIGVAVSALVLTTVGWFVSARLTERVQTRLFRYNIINAARIDLVAQIREEQDWSGQVTQLANAYRLAKTLRDIVPGLRDSIAERIFWLEQSSKGQTIIFRKQAPGRTLTMVLEELELLFPETRRIRYQLGHASLQTLFQYSTWLTDLQQDDRREATITAMEQRLGRNADYSALLEDLRIHIQNSALSEIMDRRIDLRKPRDQNVPLMIMKDDGLLDVVERGASWPIMTQDQAAMLGRASVLYPP